MKIHIIKDEAFVTISKDMDFKRFFQYWKKAEHSACMINGRQDTKKS